MVGTVESALPPWHGAYVRCVNVWKTTLLMPACDPHLRFGNAPGSHTLASRTSQKTPGQVTFLVGAGCLDSDSCQEGALAVTSCRAEVSMLVYVSYCTSTGIHVKPPTVDEIIQSRLTTPRPCIILNRYLHLFAFIRSFNFRRPWDQHRAPD